MRFWHIAGLGEPLERPADLPYGHVPPQLGQKRTGCHRTHVFPACRTCATDYSSEQSIFHNILFSLLRHTVKHC